jgi:hypothetical protein
VTTLPLTADGCLPVGRWSCTLDDLAPFHERADRQRRRDLWLEWEHLTDSVRALVGAVPAVWIGGSYFTAKSEPGDIDCVYVLDREAVQTVRAVPRDAWVLEVVATSQVKAVFQLRVDSYVLPWWPQPGVNRGSGDRRVDYLETRGYWDELWQRDRSAAGVRGPQVPSKGYVEVILDGYK